MTLYCMPRGSLNGSQAVYALLEYAYAKSFGENLPEIAKTLNGKPYFPAKPNVYFSLSHTKTHVLCALSDVPVGVDIESPRSISLRAIEYFSSPEERALFDPLDLWVLKESYIKLIGATLPEIKKLRFSRNGDKIVPPEQAVISQLYCVDGCHTAVSAFGGNLPESIIFFDDSSALIKGSSGLL